MCVRVRVSVCLCVRLCAIQRKQQTHCSPSSTQLSDVTLGTRVFSWTPTSVVQHPAPHTPSLAIWRSGAPLCFQADENTNPLNPPQRSSRPPARLHCVDVGQDSSTASRPPLPARLTPAHPALSPPPEVSTLPAPPSPGPTHEVSSPPNSPRPSCSLPAHEVSPPTNSPRPPCSLPAPRGLHPPGSALPWPHP